jgi:DNA-binding response OmpR family regulator
MATSSNHILIVDDDPSLRRMLARSLRLSGFTSLEASDGNAALQVAQDAHPAAVLLDLMMPGESGLAVLERLRDIGLRVPVLILSGNDEPETREAIARSSANAYFVKPVSVAKLIEQLRALTAESAG